jgi:thioredoxin reductase (NADPH)
VSRVVGSYVRAEPFPDLGDESIYPRLSRDELDRLAERGERRSFAVGQVLIEQGERDAPFFIVERGLVDFVDRQPHRIVWFGQVDSATFIGDIALSAGGPAIAACIAAEPTDVIAFDRPGLRALLADWPAFGELVRRTLAARLAWLERHGDAFRP